MVPYYSQTENERASFRPESLAGSERWLSQRQIAELFGTKTTVVADLIRHLYKTRTLNKTTTIRKQEVEQDEGKRRVTRQLNCYNRDVILAVGWRVHSRQGEQFRQWAYQLMENELARGQRPDQPVIASAGDVWRQLFAICYRGLQRLLEFERGKVALRNTSMLAARSLEYMEVLTAVDFLRSALFAPGEAEAFGEEKTGELEPLLASVLSREGLRDRYPSLEEKAGQLLWLIVRRQPFRDGNLRIGAFLFLWFLHRNGLLRRDDGSLRVPGNALVPMVLLVARSEESERESVVHLVASLINREN